MKASLQRPKHSIQDILNRYWSIYLKDKNRQFKLESDHLHAINLIKSCQTSRLGLYNFACTCCGDTHTLAASCKHRFCNHCGNADTFNWVNKISKKLPDIKYRHIVFTLPKSLRAVCRRNKSVIYNLMFRCSREVLLSMSKHKYGLLAGVISVLHSNGSDLKYHPHIHNILSCGGFTAGGEFREITEDYFYAQRVLANEFRKLFLKGFGDLVNAGRLHLPHRLSKSGDYVKFVNRLKSIQWIVNIDRPLEGVEKIIAYVGRYTKKSCISERRILDISGGYVEFSYKDYKNSKRGDRPKESRLRLSATDFLDRLLEHMPEKGFKVVRYGGLFSSYYLGKIDSRYLCKDLNISDYDYEELEELGVDLRDCPYRRYRKQVYEKTGVDPLFCYTCRLSMKLIEIKYVKNGKEKSITVYENSS